MTALRRLDLAVIAERRPGVTRWQEHVWRVVAVQEEVPPLAPWTMLRDGGADGRRGGELWFAGTAELALHRSDTPNYKDNLESAWPLVWALLRPAPGTPSGMALAAVTVDPGEAEVLSENPSDTLEALPMPPALASTLAAFVREHHVERAFHKRKRDRADSEALGRRAPGEPESWGQGRGGQGSEGQGSEGQGSE